MGKKTDAAKLLIGAHTSVAGGLYKGLLEGLEIGATTVQIFTANQKRWQHKPLEQEAIDKWKETLEETGLQKIMCHDSYLINLGSPNPENLAKSRKAFSEEIERCKALDLAYLNFHPGAAVGSTEEACIACIIESLLEIEPLMHDTDLILLLETTAGQGTTMGHSFEQQRDIIDGVKKKIPIGVCIDTCHIFAAGYDLRTPKACDQTLKEFDKIVGLKYLYAFHLNDSMKPFASRKDRHAHLGEGEIGTACFEFLMNDPRTRELPKYLETPEGPSRWVDEIALLRKMAQ